MYEIHVAETTDGYVTLTPNNAPTHAYLGPEFLCEFTPFTSVNVQTPTVGPLATDLYKHHFPARDLITGEEIPVLACKKPNVVFGLHTRAFKKEVSYKPNSAAAVTNRLEVAVAKRLLELAQRKHETCPITAEEFIDGHTAVFNCGHLFTDTTVAHFPRLSGLSKCPICRAHSLPAYV